MKYSFITALVSIYMMALATATAQTEAVIPIRAQIAALSLDQTLDDLTYRQGQSFEPLFIPNAAPSNAYDYEGPPTLYFYQGSPVDLETTPPVASVQLPESGKFLLLFIPQEKGTYRVTALPNSATDFPENSFRFFNLCDFAVAGALNDDKFKLEPRSQDVVSFEIGNRPKLTVQLATARDDNWKLVYRSKWDFTNGQRVNVFFVPDELQPSGIRIRRYYELAPVEETE